MSSAQCQAAVCGVWLLSAVILIGCWMAHTVRTAALRRIDKLELELGRTALRENTHALNDLKDLFR